LLPEARVNDQRPGLVPLRPPGFRWRPSTRCLRSAEAAELASGIGARGRQLEEETVSDDDLGFKVVKDLIFALREAMTAW
jgi:hypothetical protein